MSCRFGEHVSVHAEVEDGVVTQGPIESGRSKADVDLVHVGISLDSALREHVEHHTYPFAWREACDARAQRFQITRRHDVWVRIQGSGKGRAEGQSNVACHGAPDVGDHDVDRLGLLVGLEVHNHERLRLRFAESPSFPYLPKRDERRNDENDALDSRPVGRSPIPR